MNYINQSENKAHFICNYVFVHQVTKQILITVVWKISLSFV